MSTTTAAPARVFGSGIRRREDPRLLTGTARYTADFSLPGMVHAAILRSVHGHARIRGIDVSRAKQAPGVVAVYTGADTESGLQCIPCAWLLPNAGLKVSNYRAMATDAVRYVGDAVAVVVAESEYQAYDALELIEVDYEPLPAVVDPQKAVAPGAPQLHADIPNNVAFHWTVEGGDVAAAFSSAPVVVRDRIIQQRLIPTAMETRGAVAQFTPATGELTLWNTTQNPHIVRFILSAVTGVPEDRLRVVAPEVGGGFGSKIPQIQGDFITAFCSMKLGRPVKWIETRSENYQSTTHGRDHVQEVELAATNDGRILGLRCTVWAGMGAFLSTAAPGIPTILHGLMLSGPYNGSGCQRGRVWRLHQHDAGRGISRGGASGSDVHARTDDGRACAQAEDGSGGNQAAQSHPAIRQRPRRDHRSEVRQRELLRRPRQGADPHRIREAAQRTSRGARRRPLHGDRRDDLCGDLRSGTFTGRRRDRLPGWPLGKRHRPVSPERQSERVHRCVPTRARRRDDVRAGGGRRARRGCGRRQDCPR